MERTGRTRQEAEDTLTAALVELVGERGSPISGTVSDLVNEFLEQHQGSPATLAAYRSAWRSAGSDLGALTMREVTPQRVARVYHARSRAGKSTKTLAAVLRGSFDYGVTYWGLSENPAKAAPAPRQTTAPNRRWLTPAELTDIVAVCEKYEELHRNSTQGLALFVRTLTATACRVGEALALTKADLAGPPHPTLALSHHMDATGARVKGRKHESSNRRLKIHTVPITRALWSELRAVEGDVLFPARGGGHRSVQNIGRSFRAAMKEAGIPLPGFHAIRRSVLTWVAQERGIEIAAALAGHSRSALTEMIYQEAQSLAPDVTGTLAAVLADDVVAELERRVHLTLPDDVEMPEPLPDGSISLEALIDATEDDA